MTRENSRRGFAKSLLGWGTLAYLSTGLPRLSAAHVPVRSALANIFHEKSSAAAMGKEYLARVGGKADAEIMMESVARALSLSPDRAISIESARALLKRRIREDFRSGNTVSLQGWVVSLTEAQVCTIVTLNEASAG